MHIWVKMIIDYSVCMDLHNPLLPNLGGTQIPCTVRVMHQDIMHCEEFYCTAMQAYLRAQGQWFVFSTPHPADEFNSWDENNEKALGNITLCISPSIQTAIADLVMVKEVWDHLKENYGASSISSAYAELSWLLTMTIPAGSHPAPTVTKMLSHFTYLKDAGFEFPANV